MTDHDDPRPDASADLADDGGGGSDASRSDASQPELPRSATPPPQIDHVVSYGRLVNVLAAVTDRLAEKGHNVTEAQTRLILQSLRSGKGDAGEPEDEPFRLSKLAQRTSEVVRLDASFVAALIEDVVETQDR